MAPCGWTVTTCGVCAAECSSSGDCWNTYSPAVQERAQAIAAQIMWAATGRQYGPCEVTVMPARQCGPSADDGYATYPLRAGSGLLAPVIDGGLWYNRPGGACCPGACEVALEGPTTTAAITSVSVGGDDVDPGGYVVMDGYLLVRIDGGCWPCCPGYSDPETAFTVVYDQGLTIPAAVQAAFETLACETAKACDGGECMLPRTLTRLSRQGVDLEVAEIPTDPSGLILTGIKTVDDVIRAVNPGQLMAAPLVLSPDMPMPRRVT